MRDTINMAREAHAMIYNSPFDPKKLIDITFTPEHLKAFEALVRADEREAFAKVCEEVLEHYRGTHMGKHAELVGDECAAAIRARGNT